MTLTWRQIYIIYFLYRSAFTVLGMGVVSRFTTLGDSTNYNSGYAFMHGIAEHGSTLFVLSVGQLSNWVTRGVGWVFYQIFFGSSVLVSIGFQAVAFAGIVHLLNKFDEENRFKLLILFSFPTFNLWTSLAGKEAIVVFSVCVILGYIYDLFLDRGRISLKLILAAVVLKIYKIHFFAPIIILAMSAFVGKHLRSPTVYILLGGAFSLVLLAMAGDSISALIESMPRHFIDARSNRPDFWVEPYDWWLKAPEGMYLSFIGPTLEEVYFSPLHLVSFVESWVLLFVMMYFVLNQGEGIPAFSAAVVIITVFWTLFINYPTGVMNPGTALRYRCNYLPFLYVAAVGLLPMETYLRGIYRRQLQLRGLGRLAPYVHQMVQGRRRGVAPGAPPGASPSAPPSAPPAGE